MSKKVVLPIPAYRFVVRINKSSSDKFEDNYDASFQEVTGISAEIPTEDLQEGGENRFIYRLPQPVKYPNLILKRGVILANSELNKWCTDILSSGYVGKITLQDLTISLLDESNAPVLNWNIKKAYPVKWEYSSLGADKSELLVQTIELAYHGIEEKK